MTTVELLVIVAILALMSGMAFMAYHNYHKESLVASTAFQIQKLLSTARTQAIRSETVCGATFLLGQDHRLFWLDEDYDVASGGFDRPKITTPEPVNDFVELEIVDIATTTTQAENPVLSVLFSADGRSIAPDGGSQGALFHLIHTSADPDLEENYTSIRVFGATGRVRVYPGERR